MATMVKYMALVERNAVLIIINIIIISIFYTLSTTVSMIIRPDQFNCQHASQISRDEFEMLIVLVTVTNTQHPKYCILTAFWWWFVAVCLATIPELYRTPSLIKSR